MYIDKLIKKEVITLLISVAFLVVVFIGVTFAKFLSVDKGEKTVINMGDLNISFCNDSTCDTTYSNIGQVIGTKVENGVTVPASIYPFKNDGTYSNETPYIFKVENTGTLDSTIKIKLKEDATYTPTGDYSSYTRLSLKYPEHLKVAIRKRVLYQDTGYQLGDVNMDGIVNHEDIDMLHDIAFRVVSPSDIQKKLADINEDGKITESDATRLYAAILGKSNDIYSTKIYTYTDLEDGVIFKDDIIKSGESATYFLWLYLDSTTPNDVQKTFFVGNIDVEGEFVPKNTIFCTTGSELTDGGEYVNGQYTYSYSESTNGWSVQLIDPSSTDPITSEVCTYINNKPIKIMGGMFNNSQATSIDLSSINTENVINMQQMFEASGFTTLDLSNFDTSKVTDMSGMFSWSQATEIKGLENFDTNKVTNMNGMFSDSQVTNLNLSNFDTSNVTAMVAMFADSQATEIKGLENFDTSKVTDMRNMFRGSQASTLDLSSFDTSKVTDMKYMFYKSKLKTIYVSDKFKTNSVTSSTNMFTDSTNLVGGEGTVYDSNNVDATYARIDGGTRSPGYFTDITSNNIPEPNSFNTDTWRTIVNAVKNNNISKYKIGDTKTINMGTYGTHTLRIANTSTPSECSTAGFSQTACGFVLEFTDIITTRSLDSVGASQGILSTKWGTSELRTFINNDIYNLLPLNLKTGILDTFVLSSNDNVTDKIYLLATNEVWSGMPAYDNIYDKTRQLDYYKNNNVSDVNNITFAIKKNGTTITSWWLRSINVNSGDSFAIVYTTGDYSSNDPTTVLGVSPAFRIG